MEAENQVHRASQHTTLVDAELPIVVLIDRGSASASEILAAALGESGRAHLLGEQTYGKGSVQQVRHFDQRAVKVTTSHYLTPSGASLDAVGVTPHQELARTRTVGGREGGAEGAAREWPPARVRPPAPGTQRRPDRNVHR